MDRNTIVAAMEDARHERDIVGQKLLKLRELQERKAQLDSFIAQCQLLLGGESQEPKAEALFDLRRQEERLSSDSGEKERLLRDSTYWKKAEAIFVETSNKPLMLSQIVQEFRKRGYKLSEKHPKEVIRTAIRNKPDVFAYDGDKFTYWLKDYPVAEPSSAEQQRKA
jgi:hypothetical protein